MPMSAMLKEGAQQRYMHEHHGKEEIGARRVRELVRIWGRESHRSPPGLLDLIATVIVAIVIELCRLGLGFGEKSQFVLFIHNNEYYLLISNRYQSGEKQKEGSVNHILRIFCPSPIWSFGVGSTQTWCLIADYSLNFLSVNLV